MWLKYWTYLSDVMCLSMSLLVFRLALSVAVCGFPAIWEVVGRHAPLVVATCRYVSPFVAVFALVSAICLASICRDLSLCVDMCRCMPCSPPPAVVDSIGACELAKIAHGGG